MTMLVAGESEFHWPLCEDEPNCPHHYPGRRFNAIRLKKRALKGIYLFYIGMTLGRLVV
jgi:hypothetical protein